ncbi:hypothetical protein C8T65DRAFT_40506 [Cerioporus squamosus]|nr:hypothetical protein C8T65DRAFT_40506 [Cerioporus squamosus]
MIAPLTGDEKIPAPPPKEAKDMAPPEYSTVFASSNPTRGASSPHTSASAFDTAMLTPDVVRRASASSSSSHTSPASASTSALSPSPSASPRTSSSSSRTPYPYPSSSSHRHSKSQPELTSPPREHKQRSSGAKFVRAVSTGLLAIVLPPIAVGGVAIAATGVVLYGGGKLVEGIGRGISVGPEMAWKAYKSERGRKARQMFSGGKRDRAASVPPREKAEAEVGKS